MTIFNVALVLFFLMLFIQNEAGINSVWILLPFFLAQILSIAIIILYVDSSMLDRARSVSESILRLICYVFLALSLEKSFPLYACSILLALELTVKILCSHRRMHKSIKLSILFEKMFLAVMILCMIFVSLKIDLGFNMAWEATLWTVWVILFVMVFTSILLIALIGAAIISYRLEESTNEDIYLILWLFIVNTGYWVSGGFLLNAMLFSEMSTSDISILPLIVLSGITLLTLRLRKVLVSGLMGFLGLNSTEAEKRVSVSTQIVWIFKKVPQMLLRSSNTYFVAVDMIKTENSLYRGIKSLDSHLKAPETHRNSKSNLELFWTGTEQKSTEMDESLKEAVCMLCCENESNAVVMNCGHGGICLDCGKGLWEKNGVCHMCRMQIDELLVVKPFSSSSHAIKVAGSILKS